MDLCEPGATPRATRQPRCCGARMTPLRAWEGPAGLTFPCVAQACGPTVTVPTVSVGLRLHDRTHQFDLVVELPALRRGQLAQRFDGDGEPASGAPLVPHPPTTPSTSSTG
jgi:hypothetical protein